jgi:hypothetical protein
MGDLRSAIHDDIKQYEKLCGYFNEKIVYDKHGPNPYCSHSHKLQKRWRSGESRAIKSTKRKRR